ncbi:MAG: MarR family transcriptional regulator [Deltaproteobacteria bacterium]|nr:MarR family transcriptional regulator [Deltaproteobacteria bacterium]
MQTTFPEPKYFICSLTTLIARKMVAYYNRVLAPLGLTAQQMIALGVLWREENVSLGIFARRAGIGKAAAATMIKRLEQMGLVSKEANPEDGRLNVLKLTDKARKLAPQVAEKVAALERNIESAIGPENVRSLIEALTIIRDLKL